ncbi:hypothetical protein LIER_22823 [Lithospermum erythrorhizon]|uniref:Retrotransposon gag domain-containing protein n=1 Tax=Lithospermum erythrorhizon TaxID=34254 RepID=A0AAV3QYM1_LITER
MDKFRASIVADSDERTQMDIHQKPRETLRSYATRFEDLATKIPTANKKVTMISFFHGLRYWPIKKKLVLEPPGTGNQLSKLVIQYIKLEEITLTRRFEGPKKISGSGRYSLYPTLGPGGRIYAQIKYKKILQKSHKIKVPPHRRDLKKYCEYHKDHGHDTDECRLLKAEIEKLIKRGQLREFVKKDQIGSPRRYRESSPRKYTNDRRQERGSDHSPLVTGRVDTISGGIVGGGDTSNSGRKYARRAVYALGSRTITHDKGEISFSDKELAVLELPHDDLLVVSPIISNFVVTRMLVDTGSSDDILYLRAYDKLGLTRKHLKLVATPLTGFTGHSINPVRIAELDVIAGNASRTVTVRAAFTVVDIVDPSYNGLIARHLLTALLAIVSSLHPKMKFPTLGGVGEMSGD